MAEVLMAMSGGLDSTVAAHLLKEQGHRVTGITLKLPAYNNSGKFADTSYLHEAEQLAEKLGMKHHVVDASQVFETNIVHYFIDEYLRGRTPNPCTRCNKQIKWNLLTNLADELGINYISTGHYARIREENGRFLIRQAKSLKKDQSYFLWQLSSSDLKRTILPLGSYDKEAIRQIARNLGFNTLAAKRESFDVCFIADNDYRKFLKKQVQDIAPYLGNGYFVDESGNTMGKHRGFPFYTVGQRKGLDVAAGYPVYVKNINARTNTITLAPQESLLQKEMLIHQTNFPAFRQLPHGLEVKTKIRYRHPGVKSKLYMDKSMVKVIFDEPVSAVAPGQSAVFMQGDTVVGGGIIFK